MPLNDLVEYFNQRIRAEQGLSQPPLFLQDGRVEGRFAGIRLATLFQPLRRSDDGLAIAGHAAELQACREDGGNTLPAELFEHAEGGRVVGLDRLCRTIHMLNYLPGAHEGGYLFLVVHPRHVLGVKCNHGAYFEDVIFRCGLAPERVVITLAMTAAYHDQLPRLLAGLGNYRRHGYATAVGFEQGAGRPDWTNHLAELRARFAPDFLRLPAGLLTAGNAPPGLQADALVNALGAMGTRLVVEGITDEHQLEAARALGAGWLAGDWIETPARGGRRRA
jgi:EAL domain-containing protein (putative c-di-GMP-specific phosphodiesterase class I)